MNVIAKLRKDKGKIHVHGCYGQNKAILRENTRSWVLMGHLAQLR